MRSGSLVPSKNGLLRIRGYTGDRSNGLLVDPSSESDENLGISLGGGFLALISYGCQDIFDIKNYF